MPPTAHLRHLPRKPLQPARTARPRRPGAPPALRPTLLMALLMALLMVIGPTTAAAHGTVVMGAVTANPDPPRPGQTLVVTVDLQNSGRAPVEGAKLSGELRPVGRPDASGTPLAFQEYKEPYGTYRARLTAPAAGSYTLTVRDRTYPKENVAASVTLAVGGTAPNGTLDFTFPPVADSRSVQSWLLWVIGLPVAVGVVGTFLVLRSKGNEDGEGDRSDTQD